MVVFSELGLEDVEERNRLFWLLTRFEFLVFLNDCVSFFDFCLVGGDLVSRERLPSKALKHRLHITRGEVVLRETYVLEHPVLFEDLSETFSHTVATEFVVRYIEHFQRLVLLSTRVGGEEFSYLLQIGVGET